MSGNASKTGDFRSIEVKPADLKDRYADMHATYWAAMGYYRGAFMVRRRKAHIPSYYPEDTMI